MNQVCTCGMLDHAINCPLRPQVTVTTVAVTHCSRSPPIDIPSIMRAGGYEEGVKAERARVVELAREAVNHLYGMNNVAESDRSSYEAAKSFLYLIIGRADG